MMLPSSLSAAILLISTVVSADTQPAAQIPLEAFFRNPAISGPRLSPDGKHIAFVFSQDDHQRVFVRPAVGGEAVGLVDFPISEVRLGWLAWANSNRLLLSGVASDPNATKLEPRETRLYAINRGRPRLKWLGRRWPTRGPDWLAWQTRFEDRVISMLRDDRDSVLISHLGFGQRTPSLSRMNIYSGRLHLLQASIAGVERWHVDPQGEVRAAEAFGRSSDGRSYTLLARSDVQKELAAVFESEDYWKTGYRFAGFHRDPNLLYVLADHAGRDALYEFDIEARTLGPLVFAHPEVDVLAAHYSEARKKIVGAEYIVDQPGIGFFDEDAGKEQALIDRSLRTVQAGETTNRIVSTTQDGDLVILEVSSQVQPPVYYAYDRSKKQINFVFEQYPGIPTGQLARVERIDFEARDGTKIPGYLTFPRDVARSKLPMIVLPHGGPGSRAAKVYDPVVQFFANRGFAVLQVNFRGSSGFGQAFRLAGYREWGKAIQDDISDGVRWAIDRGFADPDRIGIFGTGYGGYSALMGLVLAPDLYRAGASYAGIAELEWIFQDGENFLWELEVHGKLIGAGDSDREALHGRSPLGRIEEIRVPVLLGHGARDPRVGVKHSRRLAQALKTAGKTVEYHEYEDEFHGLALESNRIAFYRRLLEFFETHLAPQAPPADPGGAPESEPSTQ